MVWNDVRVKWLTARVTAPKDAILTMCWVNYSFFRTALLNEALSTACMFDPTVLLCPDHEAAAKKSEWNNAGTLAAINLAFYVGPEKNYVRTEGSPSDVRDLISASQIETLKFDVRYNEITKEFVQETLAGILSLWSIVPEG